MSEDAENTAFLVKFVQDQVHFVQAAELLPRRQDTAAAFTKSYSPKAFPFAITFHDDLITIFEKTTLFARGQVQGLAAAPCQFKKASTLVFGLSANGTSCHEIACLEIAAVRGMVRQHLSDGPI